MSPTLKLLNSASLRYYFFFVFAFIIASITGFELLFYICPSLIMVCLGLHFYSFRKEMSNSINGLVYIALGIIAITYMMFFPPIKNQFEPIGGWFFMMAHQFYLQVFKKEGAMIFESKKVNWLVIISPILLCFGYIGLKLVQIPDSFYIISLIYTTHKCFLFLTALFRPVNRQSYYFVVTGLVFSLMSDIISSIYIFESKSSYNLWAILPYMIAQFFIINGIILGNKKGEFHGNGKLKRFVQTFFKF
jgi:hypothetical protein